MSALLDAPVLLRRLGRVEYGEAHAAMREFTARRDAGTPDELWLLEHPPVYTLGQAAGPAHGPDCSTHGEAAAIPVLRSDRGGDITYHGPGQAVLYTLIDLGRRGLRVRAFVHLLEQAAIALLAGHGVRGARRDGAPGVYVDGAKVAALGIRVSRGCALHGLSLNVDLDLSPFAAIDPCGMPGLAVTRTADLGIAAGCAVLGERLAALVLEGLGHA